MVTRGWRHGKMQVLGSIREKRADAPIAISPRDRYRPLSEN